MSSRPLQIGINALFRGKPTGVANYIIHLVRELARLDRHNRYDLLVTEANRCYFDVSAENFRLIVCPGRTDSPMYRRAWEQAALPPIVRRRKWDILHCPTNVLPLFARCRCVVTVLDCQCFEPSIRNTFLRSRFNRVFMRTSLWKADRILAISASTKAEIQRHLGVDGHRIWVTHLGQDYTDKRGNGPDTGAQTLPPGITRKYLLFVGFPHYRKNLPGFLKAFALAREQLPEEYDMVICGDIETVDESDYPNILRAAEELGITDCVKGIRYLPLGQLQHLISRADAFVFPTFYEGFGLPVIEAMACGTPVLVSDIPTMHEVAGDAGVYVDPYDTRDMARGICRILTDVELRERLVNAGRARAARFTWENTAKVTLDCYRELGEAC